MPSGLQSGEVLPVDDQRHYAIAYRRHRLDVEGIAFSKLDPGEKREERQPVSWLALKSKYFIVGLLQRDSSDAFAELHATGGVRSGKAATHMATTVVAVLTDGSFSYDVYAGPQEFKRMLALGRGFQNSNPYGGWLQPLVQPVAVLVMRFLLWLRDTTQLNYGWVLVIFGVVVRLLLWPLNQKAMRTSLRMQRIQPELSEVQKKHKENPQKLQEEIMRVYKSHGMTPFSPLAGCLPMLIPMPVLFALFFVFQNTIEFRGVPFLWLPDISLKDPLYIIPVFMGLSMFVMSWLGSRGTPPNPQTKMLLYFLPAMMTVLFLNFASGLNLYYAVQNLAAMPQQWLIARERRQSGVTAPAVQASSRKAKT
jgi:YidC/Oxa1 family membrane protein insertase